MNDPASVQKYKPLKVKPAYGELILVKYNNEKWQRGKILECYEYCNRVELDIFLVDFGVVLERVNMKTVRKIREEHLHLPFQVSFTYIFFLKFSLKFGKIYVLT